MSGETAPRRMINLGCGRRIHPDWVNVDISPREPGVLRCDLSRGIPFADNSFDAAYHSHVLEHIRRTEALPFIRECCRILKPGGILRVATPDLERICRIYLDKLGRAAAGEPADDYDWMMLEIYDQTVREESGGGIAEYLRRKPLANEAFVIERSGQEGRDIINSVRQEARQKPRTALRKLVRRPRGLVDMVGYGLARLFFGAEARRALDIGRFRLGGEVHQWMYDRFSLARLMGDAGLCEAKLRGAGESGIAGWKEFNLDTLPDGSTTKPDSFFMEAVKPS